MTKPDAPANPPPLVGAASLVAVEGILLTGYAALEAASVHAVRAAMGITTAVLFALLGLGLVACAWLVVRGRAWARSPVIVAQLMFLGLAWSSRGGTTTWVTAGMAMIAVLVIVGLLHPASVAALSDRGDERA